LGSDIASGEHRMMALLGAHQRSIAARIRRTVPDEADRADLLQEVSLIIIRCRIEFIDDRHFSNWCMGVVDHTVRRWQRSLMRRKRREFEAGQACWSNRLIVEDPELRTSNMELVRRAFEAVGDRSIRLLVARYVDCFTAEEIARAASENPATVRMRLSRLRDVVRRAIGQPYRRLSAGEGLASSSRKLSR
jgi:RNA polymerase sigma factor (sigma-70 family)